MTDVIFKKADIEVIERLANRVKAIGGNIIYYGKYKPKGEAGVLNLIEQGKQILLVYNIHDELVFISNGTISYNIVGVLRLGDSLKNSRIRLENFLMDAYGTALFFDYNKRIDYSKLDLSYLQSVPNVVLTDGDTELKNWYTTLANKIISYKPYSSSDEYRLPFVKAFNYENNYIYKFTGKHHLVDNVYSSHVNGRLLVYNTPASTGDGTSANNAQVDNTSKSITFTIQNTDITADSIYMNLAIQRIYVDGAIKRLELNIKSPMANKNLKRHVKVIYRLFIDSVYTECKDLIIKLPNDAVGCELYTTDNTIDALENISIYTENNEECEVLDSTLNRKENNTIWFSLCGSQVPYSVYRQFIRGKNKPSRIDCLIRTKKHGQPLMQFLGDY